MTKNVRDALVMAAIVVSSLGGLWLLFNLRLDDAPPSTSSASASASASSSASASASPSIGDGG